MPKIMHRSEKGEGLKERPLVFLLVLISLSKSYYKKEIKTYVFENNIKCFELFLGLVLFDRNIMGF